MSDHYSFHHESEYKVRGILLFFCLVICMLKFSGRVISPDLRFRIEANKMYIDRLFAQTLHS